MWYVGIDGALNRSGVVALLDDDKVPFDEIVIRPRGKSLVEKLHSIRVQLHQFIRECRDYAEHDIVAAIETPFASRNIKTHKLLSMVHGVQSLVAYDHDALILHVDNMILKKFVCGVATNKDPVSPAVYEMWGYERLSNDLTDGYALAQFARCVLLGKAGGFREWQTDLTAPFAPSVEYGRV